MPHCHLMLISQSLELYLYTNFYQVSIIRSIIEYHKPCNGRHAYKDLAMGVDLLKLKAEFFNMLIRSNLI